MLLGDAAALPLAGLASHASHHGPVRPATFADHGYRSFTRADCVLDDALQRNSVVQAILDVAVERALPNWYLGAGGVPQTVWNQLHGFEPSHGIKDYDLVYFDSTDLSVETETAVEQDICRRLPAFDTMLDVKNEARVHL